VNFHLDIEASVIATQRQNAGGAIKIWEDLDRYERVIAATTPDVVVECGTLFGGSARWFAARVPQVVTVDIAKTCWFDDDQNITAIVADSANHATVEQVADHIHNGDRVMVVLDSAHTAEHVFDEITFYGPLVSPGCYLVVEDGIVRWMYGEDDTPGPLEPIAELLDGNPDWVRDEHIEQLHPVTMHPAGWWRREP
jgi:cephalosporin hydroxylase